MEIDNGGVAGIFNQQAPDLPLAAAPSPFPTRAQGLVLAPLTINANTKNKDGRIHLRQMDAAAREPEGSAGPSRRQQRRHRRRALPEDLAKQPWLKVYDEQTPNSVPQLVAGQETKTPEIQQIVLEQVLKVLQGGVDPQKAMDDAQTHGPVARAAQVTRTSAPTATRSTHGEVGIQDGAAGGQPLDAVLLHRAGRPLSAAVPGLSAGAGAATQLHVDVAARRRSDHVFVGLDNYRDLVEHERFPHTLLDHRDLHRRLRGRCRSGWASRRRCCSTAVSRPRRGAGAGDDSVGSAAGRRGADLHLDASTRQYGIFNHALRALGLRSRSRELARQPVARAAGDPDHDDLADLPVRLGRDPRRAAGRFAASCARPRSSTAPTGSACSRPSSGRRSSRRSRCSRCSSRSGRCAAST